MKYLFILFIFAACSKESPQHHEIWQRQHITSNLTGSYCLPQPAAPYDTLQYNWNIPNPMDSINRVGIWQGKSTQDSCINGTFHFTLWVKCIKSWTN